jgi:hypothetical protein
MRPVLVGLRLASGSPGAVTPERDLRADDGQDQTRHGGYRERLAEQDDAVDEREYGREIVPERGPLLPEPLVQSALCVGS